MYEKDKFLPFYKKREKIPKRHTVSCKVPHSIKNELEFIFTDMYLDSENPLSDGLRDLVYHFLNKKCTDRRNFYVICYALIPKEINPLNLKEAHLPQLIDIRNEYVRFIAENKSEYKDSLDKVFNQSIECKFVKLEDYFEDVKKVSKDDNMDFERFKASIVHKTNLEDIDDLDNYQLISFYLNNHFDKSNGESIFIYHHEIGEDYHTGINYITKGLNKVFFQYTYFLRPNGLYLKFYDWKYVTNHYFLQNAPKLFNPIFNDLIHDIYQNTNEVEIDLADDDELLHNYNEAKKRAEWFKINAKVFADMTKDFEKQLDERNIKHE